MYMSLEIFILGAITCGLRVVFDIKSEIKITGGDGTSKTPYELGM